MSVRGQEPTRDRAFDRRPLRRGGGRRRAGARHWRRHRQRRGLRVGRGSACAGSVSPRAFTAGAPRPPAGRSRRWARRSTRSRAWTGSSGRGSRCPRTWRCVSRAPATSTRALREGEGAVALAERDGTRLDRVWADYCLARVHHARTDFGRAPRARARADGGGVGTGLPRAGPRRARVSVRAVRPRGRRRPATRAGPRRR